MPCGCAGGGSATATAALLAHGADIEAATVDGVTPLILAAYYGHTDVLRVLLAHKTPPADLGRADEWGTALDNAEAMGHATAARMLATAAAVRHHSYKAAL
eukprot:TRINITY_DN2189_c0_g1_i2.p1 TRINITY_DN2189_c0_g1~~TRINITY_DN2189_c0_g1_i2.p1  ORF type:complete len:101 (+),score=15.85 TRINITY_DN2189_c0_g1_i2:391-693(+)